MLSFIKRAIRNRLTERLRPTLEDWFYYWLCAQNAEDRRSTAPRNAYYEFGVGWGRTLTAFANAAVRAAGNGVVDLKEIKIVGFDSFEGLPEKSSAADDHPDWNRGTFAYDEDYVRKKVSATRFPADQIEFVKGFYDESLTESLADRLKSLPPAIITIDVDYYSSTAQVLEFVRPLLQSGAVFYFDDLYSFHLHPDMGQPKALREFNEAHGNLSPLTEFDFGGRTFIYSAPIWEHATQQEPGRKAA